MRNFFFKDTGCGDLNNRSAHPHLADRLLNKVGLLVREREFERERERDGVRRVENGKSRQGTGGAEMRMIKMKCPLPH